MTTSKDKAMEYFKITDDAKLKTSALLQKCRDKFPVWSWYDDKDLDKDFPKPKKATTRYFKKVVEADEDLANKSAENLEAEGIKGITLRERILMELSYFEETGKHLDIINWTLCSGSRGRGGGVPSAYWSGDGFRVSWCLASVRDPDLRSRRAFESVPSNLESLNLGPTEPLSYEEDVVKTAIETVKKAGYQVSKIL